MRKLAAVVAASALALTGCAAATAGIGAPSPATTAARPPVARSAAPHLTARAHPRAAVVVNVCRSNRAAQLVLVSITHQTAWMCAGSRLVHSSPVTTGETDNGDDTPTGTWQIEDKQTDRTLYLLDGQTYFVHYWLPFSGELYGFHDATWQTVPFGTSDYHADGSHGCVHMPLAQMAWLYDWADVGATVTVLA